MITRLSPHRHCEEPLRRSNPDCRNGKILDCFAALAMTECGAAARATSSAVHRGCGLADDFSCRHRHCEELLRRSNPDCRSGKILDCFAALAMTEFVATFATPPAPSSPCRDRTCLRSRCLQARAW
ncbi:hypothetical protein GPL17_05350 [Bradyrhizobium yuanmingense]|nr:hypothetical protein [Bradyrhizobium yuanmingense]